MIDIERIAHRGMWDHSSEKNSVVAFERAFKAGFGVETDLRDHQGEIVISHDPPGLQGEPALTFEAFLLLYRDAGATGTLALNIKADGLAVDVLRLIKKYDLTEYFVFDMSIPDMLSYLKNGLLCYSRESEYESPIIFGEQPFGASTKGVWLDCFSKIWYSTDAILSHLKSGLDVCLVSPELHGREPEAWWRELNTFAGTIEFTGSQTFGKLSVCTDSPNF